MESTAKTIADELVSMLKENGLALALESKDKADDLREYASIRLRHLSDIVGQPGFSSAVIAERDNVLLFAAQRAMNEADAVDARIIGIVHGALSIGAKALATIVL